MPYFSSQQTDPALRAAHRALEQLTDQAQELLAAVMVDAVELMTADAVKLSRVCRAALHGLRGFVDRLDPG